MRRIELIAPLIVLTLLAYWFIAGESQPDRRRQEAVDNANVTERYRRGMVELYSHRFDSAERIFAELCDARSDVTDLWIALGIAQLNQADQGVGRAMESLEEANTLSPNDARVFFCLGHVLEYRGMEGALGAFQRALDLQPNSADAHYQVAQALRAAGQIDEALGHFEVAVRLEPRLTGAWYQLSQLYRRSGRIEDSERAARRREALHESGRGIDRGLVFTELGDLSEPDLSWVLPSELAVLAENDVANAKLSFTLIATRDGEAPLAFVDDDADGSVELWTSNERYRFDALTNEVLALGGLRGLGGLAPLAGATSFAVADFTEDGRLDLAVGAPDGIRTYRRGDDGFVLEQTFPTHPRATLRAVDADLEGDIDLVASSPEASPIILINARSGLESDVTFKSVDDSPLPVLAPGTKLIQAADLDGDVDCDFVFSSPTGPQAYRSGPQWQFDPVLDDAAIPTAGPFDRLVVADVDSDGQADVIVTGPGGGSGLFLASSPDEPRSSSYFATATFVAPFDVDLDGDLDLLIGGVSETHLLVQEAVGRFVKSPNVRLPRSLSAAIGDLDSDCDLDLVLATPNGKLLFFQNDLDTTELHVAKLYLGGVRDSGDRRSNLLGLGTRVTVGVGARLRRRTHDGGVVAPNIGATAQGYQPMSIGLGRSESVDFVRLEWPDGVVQIEPGDDIEPCVVEEIEEIQRKASSCPVLFSWDGTGYRFITDFMGGGGLGFWIDEGFYGPPDPTEVVRIEPGALVPQSGELRLSVMEPMEEIAYVDELSLVAIDHPAGTSVYPDELFSTGAIVPTGRPLLIRDADRIFPRRALVDGNVEVVSKLEQIDRVQIGPPKLDPVLVGYTDSHELTLEFDELPSTGDVRLFASGWVEYPYSRVNFAASHRGDRLRPPSIDYRSSSDESWTTLHEEVGYPAGMPKTMVLDIAEAAARGARQLRIRTNMEIYWDQIFVARVAADLALEPTKCPLERATLRFGGYPREYSDDGKLPLTYHYDERDADLGYRRMPGRVTRYGGVRPLLLGADDEFAILGGGDELELVFGALPEPTAGVRRTFLLDTVGYCKDMDPLTGGRDTVAPLPYRAMSTYPPGSDDASPDRESYESEWNTRIRVDHRFGDRERR